MRDAITALEAALQELEHARAELPEDMRAELDEIIGRAKAVMASLSAGQPSLGSTEASGQAGAPG